MDKYTIAEEAYKKGYEDGKPKWISVTERLPENGTVVLVFGRRGGIYTAEFREYVTYHTWHKLNSKNHYCDPTHWMPLPEPPKEVDNG